METKMGTVEPIDSNLKKTTIDFIVGSVKKYKDRTEYHTELVEYINEMIDIN